MDNAQFKGIYVATGNTGHEALPNREEGGLWQAWERPDGIFTIQALGENKEPEGDHLLIERDFFHANFSPYSSQDAREEAKKRLRADAPDLLAMWYEQTLTDTQLSTTSAQGRFTSGSSHTGAASGNPQESSAERASASSPDEENSLVPGASGLAAETSGLAAETPGTEGGAGAQSVSGGSVDAGTVPENPDDSLVLAEERAVVFESVMRSEFESLLRQFKQDGSQTAKDDLERLVDRPGVITWKQKYMFTEFGLMLRRERQFALARKCHLRALECAPRDEHVLFNVARAEYEQGDVDTAKHYLAQAIEVAPGFDAARNFLRFLNTSQAGAEAGRPGNSV